MPKIKLNSNGLSADTLISHVQRNVESASRLLLGELSEARENCLKTKQPQIVKFSINELYFKATWKNMQSVPKPEVKSLTAKEGYSIHFGIISKDTDEQQHSAIRIEQAKVKDFYTELLKGSIEVVCEFQFKQWQGTDCAVLTFADFE